MTSIPTNWSELRGSFADQLSEVPKTFDYFFESFTRYDPTPMQFAHPLAACQDLTSRYVLFGHDNLASEALERLAPFAQQVITYRPKDMDKLSRPRFEALAFANLQAAAGEPAIDLGDIPVLLGKLRNVKNLTEEEERKIGWAHLAHGVITGLDDLLLFDPVRAGRPDPEAHFERNIQGLQRHLTQALAHGAGVESVLAAWRDYVGYFPRLYGTEMATFQELFLAARAVHTVLGGRAPQDLLSWLRSEIG